jgi:hypothetical protein
MSEVSQTNVLERSETILQPTPNAAVPRRLGISAPLARRWIMPPAAPGLNFHDPRGNLTAPILCGTARDALGVAYRLIARGVKKGDRIALVAETGAEFAALFCGAVYAGAWPVPLPLPTSFGGKDNYIDQLAVQLRSSDPTLFFYPPEIAAMGDAATAAHNAPMALPASARAGTCFMASRSFPPTCPPCRARTSAICNIPAARPVSPWRGRDACLAAQQSGRSWRGHEHGSRATAASAGCRGITTWVWSAASCRSSPIRFRPTICAPRISRAVRWPGST